MSSASSSSVAQPAGASEQIQLVQTVLAASDHYAVLQVARDATTKEIRMAYRRLALKLHPDKNRAPDAEEAFKKAAESAECLTDTVRRRAYDSPEQTETESYSTLEESEEEEEKKQEESKVGSSRTEAVSADELRARIAILQAEIDAARTSRSRSAEQPDCADDDAPSAHYATLGKSRAKQSAPEPVRQAWDGEHYTQAEFHEHYGSYRREAHWHSAQDEGTPRRRSPKRPAGTSSVAPPAEDLAGRRSAEQPDASCSKPTHLASNVHSAAHAKHTEYMTFLQVLLNDFYDIWRSLGAPKKVRASWSNQWNNMTRILEAIARDVASYNCYHELDSSLRSVVQPASVENLSGTSALLFRKVSTSSQKEAELLILLDRLALETVHKACWAEVKIFFESASGDDAAFRNECAAESARKVHESNLHLKNVADEAKRLLDVPSWTAR